MVARVGVLQKKRKNINNRTAHNGLERRHGKREFLL